MDRTYTVIWTIENYPEEGTFKCSGLTGKIAFARLMSAIKNSGPILIKNIEPERNKGDY